MIIKIFFIIFTGICSFLIIYLIGRFITGHRIGTCLVDFDKAYNLAISNSNSKLSAFKQGVSVFYKCSPFNKLSLEEWEKISEVFCSLADPKDEFMNLLLYPAKKVIKLLRNEHFLEDLKKGGTRKRAK